MSNVQTNGRRKGRAVINTADFQLGFREYHAGEPLNPDYWRDLKRWTPANSQLDYERGRLFAAWGYRQPLKYGREVSYDACIAFAQALREGAIK